jgi:hypothetical protein
MHWLQLERKQTNADRFKSAADKDGDGEHSNPMWEVSQICLECLLFLGEN